MSRFLESKGGETRGVDLFCPGTGSATKEKSAGVQEGTVRHGK